MMSKKSSIFYEYQMSNVKIHLLVKVTNLVNIPLRMQPTHSQYTYSESYSVKIQEAKIWQTYIIFIHNNHTT